MTDPSESFEEANVLTDEDIENTSRFSEYPADGPHVYIEYARRIERLVLERVRDSSSGKALARQAENAGSIPASRSFTFEDLLRDLMSIRNDNGYAELSDGDAVALNAAHRAALAEARACKDCGCECHREDA